MGRKVYEVSVLVFLIWAWVGHSVYAAERDDVPRCSDPSIDLYSVPYGFKCVTAKGGVFERGAGKSGYWSYNWKDSDGQVWGDWIGQGSQVKAGQMCADIGGVLPDKAAYERCEAQGCRELWRNSYEYYWTSTTDGLGLGVSFTPEGYLWDYDSSNWCQVRCLDAS